MVPDERRTGTGDYVPGGSVQVFIRCPVPQRPPSRLTGESPVTATQSTPYNIVTGVETVRTANKRALIAVTRGLEREALLDPPLAVAATFQDVRFVTPQTRQSYAQLAARGTQVLLYARSLHAWLAPGVRGISLDDGDPLVDEWSLVVPSQEHPVVFVATDGVPGGSDGQRPYTWAVSRDPEVVRACAQALGVHEPTRLVGNFTP